MKMKALLATLFCLIAAPSFADSSVTLPVNHLQIPAYPGTGGVLLNGPTGLHSDVAYRVTCEINNPTNGSLIIQMAYSPATFCGAVSPITANKCGFYYLNDEPVGNSTYTAMLNLKPGNNTLVLHHVLTDKKDQNVKLLLNNYDNTSHVFLESCKAEIKF